MRDIVWNTVQEEALTRVLDEYRQWDVLEANLPRPSHKLLFCGPPGCGKTVTAEAVSGELGLPLVTVRFDAVVSSLLGENGVEPPKGVRLHLSGLVGRLLRRVRRDRAFAG